MTDAEVYRAIGKRLRARRRLLSMTQSQVGGRCGLTFQQIQKYEAGLVALPVARLVTLASVLQSPIGEFFDGLQETQAPRADNEVLSWRSDAGLAGQHARHN